MLVGGSVGKRVVLGVVVMGEIVRADEETVKEGGR